MPFHVIKLSYAMPEGHRVNSLKESSAKLISKAVKKSRMYVVYKLVC